MRSPLISSRPPRTKRLPSNGCIDRAPHDLPNLPSFLEWGASDTALAFLDSFRFADQPGPTIDTARVSSYLFTKTANKPEGTPTMNASLSWEWGYFESVLI